MVDIFTIFAENGKYIDHFLNIDKKPVGLLNDLLVRDNSKLAGPFYENFWIQLF